MIIVARFFFVPAQMVSGRTSGRMPISQPIALVVRYDAMSLEFIAAGVLACLFALIALMPSFDGNWDT